ncbi:hypothetical protein DFJ74DRAFT_662832 [Hyaloraphidium curvatum]|nr:hypothetical protein DFJ74DRAFT_662832 [Hyaloraphidium curvatum]
MLSCQERPPAVQEGGPLADAERETFRRRIAQLERRVALLEGVLDRAGIPLPIDEGSYGEIQGAGYGPRLPAKLLVRVADFVERKCDSTFVRMTRMSRACYHLLAPRLKSTPDLKVDAEHRVRRPGALFEKLWGTATGQHAHAVRELTVMDNDELHASLLIAVLGRFTNIRYLWIDAYTAGEFLALFSLPLSALEELRITLPYDRRLFFPGDIPRIRPPPSLRKLTLWGHADTSIATAVLSACPQAGVELNLWMFVGPRAEHNRAALEFAEEIPAHVVAAWDRFTPQDWRIFRALVRRSGFQPTVIDNLEAECFEKKDEVCLADLQLMAWLGTVHHLKLNVLSLPQLSDFRPWPELQTLRIGRGAGRYSSDRGLELKGTDGPESVAEFALGLRGLTKAAVALGDGWPGIPMLPFQRPAEQRNQCLAILLLSTHVDLLGDEFAELRREYLKRVRERAEGCLTRR